MSGSAENSSPPAHSEASSGRFSSAFQPVFQFDVVRTNQLRATWFACPRCCCSRDGMRQWCNTWNTPTLLAIVFQEANARQIQMQELVGAATAVRGLAKQPKFALSSRGGSVARKAVCGRLCETLGRALVNELPSGAVTQVLPARIDIFRTCALTQTTYHVQTKCVHTVSKETVHSAKVRTRPDILSPFPVVPGLPCAHLTPPPISFISSSRCSALFHSTAFLVTHETTRPLLKKDRVLLWANKIRCVFQLKIHTENHCFPGSVAQGPIAQVC